MIMLARLNFRNFRIIERYWLKRRRGKEGGWQTKKGTSKGVITRSTTINLNSINFPVPLIKKIVLVLSEQN